VAARLCSLGARWQAEHLPGAVRCFAVMADSVGGVSAQPASKQTAKTVRETILCMV